ncbi:MAG: alginate lyase family protein [Acidobacteria bacterium]|nr:alginate lyase family protein [Acidobacteriota bacterium]
MRIFRKAFLLFHTLRYSTPRQLFFRLFGIIKKQLLLLPSPAPTYTLRGENPPTTKYLQHDCWNRREDLRQGIFGFLNRVERLGWPVDWRASHLPRLWQYHLHYFNYLYLLNAAEQIDLCVQWQRAHPVGKGVAWHPYPTALRIINWCKARCEHPEVLRSLYEQAAYLYRHLESHHPGNHILENARALIFAGRFFAGQGEAQRWLERGLQIYRRETPRQVLADGGHFERSPMYHALMLEGYLDVLNLLPDLEDREFFIETAKRMSDFLLSVTHPDGNLALLNDATQEIAPTTEELLNYAKTLLNYRATKKLLFPDSGYFIYEGATAYLIIDGGAISPDDLPAHAHADIFSYELSLQGKPVIVDAGVFEYAEGEMRDYVRSTRAHNTVCVDGLSQAECWGSFRVARRYAPQAVSFHRTGYRSQFQGTFEGYAKLIGDRISHQRQIECDEPQRRIVVRDALQGRGEHRVESCIHLHPDAKLTVTKNRAVVQLGEVSCVIETTAPCWDVEASWYCPEFGVKQKNKMLVAGGRLRLPVVLAYTIEY